MEAATATKPTKGQPQPETKQPETQAPERKIQPLGASRMKSGDFLRTCYMATAFEGTQPEDLTKPEYWAHHGLILKQRDRVEVWADDGAWVADVVVMGSTKNDADVRVLRVDYIDAFKPTGDAPDELKAYEVRYRGLHSQWSVVRKGDSAMVHEGSGSRHAAETWLTNHLKAFK